MAEVAAEAVVAAGGVLAARCGRRKPTFASALAERRHQRPSLLRIRRSRHTKLIELLRKCKSNGGNLNLDRTQVDRSLSPGLEVRNFTELAHTLWGERIAALALPLIGDSTRATRPRREALVTADDPQNPCCVCG